MAMVLALGVLATLGLVYLAQNDPEGGALFPQCVFKKVTGFHCAGCGSTRAAHAMMHFDLETAFRKNSLLVVTFPLLLLGIVMEGSAWLWGERYRGPRVHLSTFWAWTVPVVIFGFWILRNVPVWPFELLAPR
jgi:hypothetical protein